MPNRDWFLIFILIVEGGALLFVEQASAGMPAPCYGIRQWRTNAFCRIL